LLIVNDVKIFLVSICLISVGFFGVLIQRNNIILFLFCLEVAYAGIIVLFLLTSGVYYNTDLQIFAFIIIICIALESVIGLGFIVLIYKFSNSVSLYDLDCLDG